MENIGSLLFTGIKGTSLSKEESQMIKDLKLGGVILYSDNFENNSQLAELVNSIQALRDEYPLFIGVNHEGGQNTSFRRNFTQFPSMFELSKLNSAKIIFDAHSVMAKELKACGVNVSFSPVCDIWTNPNNKIIGERAFGIELEIVEKFTTAAIRGLQTNGILACAKHFPGHGDTLRDSHFDLPLIKDAMESLIKREVQPFFKASRARVEMMMMAHLQVDAVDEKYPTSLSNKAYEFLRASTKFSKIVITDEMSMGAISSKYSIEEACILAIAGGTDMILYKNFSDTLKAHETLKEKLKTKHLNKELVQEKISRVEKTKKEYFQGYKPIYIPEITEAFNSVIGKQILSQYQSFIDGKKTPV